MSSRLTPFRFAHAYREGPYGANVISAAETASGHLGLLEVDQPGGDYPTPGTDDLVLGLVTSASTRAVMDFGAGRFPFHAPQGDLFLSPALTPSSTWVDARHRALLMTFKSSTVQSLLEAPGGLDFGPLHAQGFSDLFVAAAVRRVWSELAAYGERSALFVDAATVAILRALQGRARLAAPEPRRGGLSPVVLRRLQARLEDELGEDISLASLAQSAAMSPFHLARAFKTSTGLTPHQWRLRRRMDHARHLLETTRLAVSEIAVRVGYGHPQAFARVFLREVGHAPRDYRRLAGAD